MAGPLFLRIPSTISQHLAFITPHDDRAVSECLWRVLQSQYQWLRNESGGAGSTRAALTCELMATTWRLYDNAGTTAIA